MSRTGMGPARLVWTSRRLGLALIFFCLGAPAVGLAQPVVTHHSIDYGGQFEPQHAACLAHAVGWLDGLERAAGELQRINSVYLAGLDALQQQALAALIGMVDVQVLLRGQGDDVPSSNQAAPPSDQRAVATVRVLQPDAMEVSRLLADTTGRHRQEEVIIALRRLMPEARELAELARALRQQAFLATGAASGYGPVMERLTELAVEVEAYVIYLDFLRDYPGTGDPASGLTTLRKAMELAPHILLFRLAEAELLLRQDRPQAALRSLNQLQAPRSEQEPSPGTFAWKDSVADSVKMDNAMQQSIAQAWETRQALAPVSAEIDIRLYARGLQLRALAQLRSGQPALAEKDLDEALHFAPEQAELWLARGATRQVRERYALMCEDYYQACVLGLCDGLAAARQRGHCLAAPDGG